jgi:hypothetical protein
MIGDKPPSPFKYNPSWILEEDFVSLIKETWIPFDESRAESTSIQFVENLKKTKSTAVSWAHEKK